MFGLFGRKQSPVALMAATDAQKRERDRSNRIAEAWARYGGAYDKPLKPTNADKEGRDNTGVNYSRRTVDIAAYYLFGRDVSFQVGGDPESPESEWLEACWDSQVDGRMPTLLDAAIAGGVTGDVFFRVYPPEEPGGFPRLVSLDAQTVRAEWDPADYKRVTAFVIEFTGYDEVLKKPVYYTHEIRKDGAKWNITESHKVDGDSVPTVDLEETWPYPFCPIFHCKNRPLPHSFYGTSDIEADLLGINDAVNMVLSNINRILRLHAHPLAYGTGITAQPVGGQDRAVGAMPMYNSPDAKINIVEMVSDLSSSFSQLEKLRDAYHELSGIPEIASGKLESVGQLSGLALQILYGPLVALTNVKRMLWGHLLPKLCAALLLMGGKGEVSPAEITVNWFTILPADKQQEATTAQSLQDAGVSKGTTIAEMGYDPEEEATKREAEAASAAKISMDTFNAGGTVDDSGLGQAA